MPEVDRIDSHTLNLATTSSRVEEESDQRSVPAGFKVSAFTSLEKLDEVLQV